MDYTSESLRETLFDALDELRADKIDAQKAQAIGKLAAQIVATVQVEVEFYKHIRRNQAAGVERTETVLKLGNRRVANGKAVGDGLA